MLFARSLVRVKFSAPRYDDPSNRKARSNELVGIPFKDKEEKTG